MKQKNAFTLIELLVVMAVISMIIAIALPNYLGIRQRARDSKKKSELVEIKNALRMYYGDFQKYPATTNGNRIIQGCGINGIEACPKAGCGADFSQGSATGCESVYMKKFTVYDGASVGYGWNYRPTTNTEDFCLYVKLENAGDTDIAASQSRCATACSGTGYNTTTNYVVCAD
jgi:prepilin-type N-terminal cleavage/methylation domain-containing protein